MPACLPACLTAPVYLFVAPSQPQAARRSRQRATSSLLPTHFQLFRTLASTRSIARHGAFHNPPFGFFASLAYRETGWQPAGWLARFLRQLRHNVFSVNIFESSIIARDHAAYLFETPVVGIPRGIVRRRKQKLSFFSSQKFPSCLSPPPLLLLFLRSFTPRRECRDRSRHRDSNKPSGTRYAFLLSTAGGWDKSRRSFGDRVSTREESRRTTKRGQRGVLHRAVNRNGERHKRVLHRSLAITLRAGYWK